MEPRLLTSSGDIVRSATGTQQGFCLSNPLLKLVMQHIYEKLKDIPGIRKTLFFRDDTALIGTPKALAAAAKIINGCSPRTGLRLRWKKYHLYGTRSTINACRLTQDPNVPKAITIHEELNKNTSRPPYDLMNSYQIA